ncbi:MAG TPA: sigma 54-interacting transcriptional regulator [Polyangiaceae bacterium]
MPNSLQYRDATTHLVPPNGPHTMVRVWVEVINAPASPKKSQLTKGALVIGAGLGADIVIDDARVSRRHAQLTLTERGLEVVDLGSRNGTFYQGQRIERIVLGCDSTLQLGCVHVRVRVEPGEGNTAGGVEDRFGDLMGSCPAMQQVIRTLERVRNSRVPLLVVGESGTGKEVVARSIHAQSRVQRGDFVTVHCGTLERESARAEFFGLGQQRDTSAKGRHLGAFELARQGTLLLDEIGDLPLSIQPLLLPVLECDAIATDRSTEEGCLPARVIASTQRDLVREVAEGRFREDLYHRLNVIKVELPPLRERGDDIVLLARHFAAEFDIRSVPSAAMDQLRSYRWPGNVRELRNVLRGYAAIGVLPQAESRDSEGGFAHLLRLALDLERPYQEQKEWLLNQFIDTYLTELLRRTNGNQSAAARIAGLDRAHLNKMVARLRQGSNK